MIREIKSKNITWLNIFNPSADDLKFLIKNFKIHPLVLNELTRPTLRPKVENYDDHLYMVLHFPIFSSETRTTLSQEIDFIFTKNTLITVHYDKIAPFEELFSQCESDEEFRGRHMRGNSAFLLHKIITTLFEFSLRELDHIRQNVDAVERKIFESKKHYNTIEEIAFIRRDILNFWRTIRPEGLALESLAERGVLFFGEDLKPYFSDLTGSYLRVLNLLKNQKEAIEALYDTHESVLTAKTNEVMKMFTILAFITFPLTLLVDILGIPSEHNPIYGKAYDFWLILGVVVVVMTTMLYIFKKKDWL